MAQGGGKAPKQITWIICLVLYVRTWIDHFRAVSVTPAVAVWSWIIGFGLLLSAVRSTAFDTIC